MLPCCGGSEEIFGIVDIGYLAVEDIIKLTIIKGGICQRLLSSHSGGSVSASGSRILNSVTRVRIGEHANGFTIGVVVVNTISFVYFDIIKNIGVEEISPLCRYFFRESVVPSKREAVERGDIKDCFRIASIITIYGIIHNFFNGLKNEVCPLTICPECHSTCLGGWSKEVEVVSHGVDIKIVLCRIGTVGLS